MKKAKRNITIEDKVAAGIIRRLWADYKQKNQGATQEWAGQQLAMSQAAFSQYLRAEIPMGTDALLKFATFFGVAPSEIRQDNKLGELGRNVKTNDQLVARTDLTREAVELAHAWQALPPHRQQSFRDSIFMECAICKHFPWLQVGRPDGTYEAFEQRLRKVRKSLPLKR